MQVEIVSGYYSGRLGYVLGFESPEIAIIQIADGILYTSDYKEIG